MPNKTVNTYTNNPPALRHIGADTHPGVITVDIPPGEQFTIGRFDVSAGKQLSSFEFDKRTKAVSRRHAYIERNAAGYSISDSDSTAGTIINGRRLEANSPCVLKDGYRVSFGHLGADYIWEEMG